MITSIATVFFALAVQEPAPTIHFNIESAKKDIVKGSVTVSIPSGWHAYQNPPKSEFENPLKVSSTTKGFSLSKVTYPPGVAMKSSGNDSMVYQGDVKIAFEGKIAKTLKPGKNGMIHLEFDINYQFCNDSTCIPPTSRHAKLNIKVGK
jgi:DsbC/DsbD-like thiol-disulfide interchange protein